MVLVVILPGVSRSHNALSSRPFSRRFVLVFIKDLSNVPRWAMLRLEKKLMTAFKYFLGASLVVLLAVNIVAQSTNVVAQPANAVSQSTNVVISQGAKRVLQLMQAKVSDPTIIAYIHAVPVDYQLSAEGLIYLKQQGVSEQVITNMLNQSGGIQPVATSPQPMTVIVVSQRPSAVAYALAPEAGVFDSQASVGYPSYYYPYSSVYFSHGGYGGVPSGTIYHRGAGNSSGGDRVINPAGAYGVGINPGGSYGVGSSPGGSYLGGGSLHR